MEKTETTYEVGDKVQVAIPQRSGSVWAISGHITAIRYMKATGRTFYVIDGKSGIRPEWCSLVEKAAS